MDKANTLLLKEASIWVNGTREKLEKKLMGGPDARGAMPNVDKRKERGGVAMVSPHACIYIFMHVMIDYLPVESAHPIFCGTSDVRVVITRHYQATFSAGIRFALSVCISIIVSLCGRTKRERVVRSTQTRRFRVHRIGSLLTYSPQSSISQEPIV